jgi:hypothetical protein
MKIVWIKLHIYWHEPNAEYFPGSLQFATLGGRFFLMSFNFAPR